MPEASYAVSWLKFEPKVSNIPVIKADWLLLLVLWESLFVSS